MKKKWICLMTVCVLCLLTVVSVTAAKEWELTLQPGETTCDLTSLKQVKDADALSLGEALQALEGLKACDLRGVNLSTDAMMTLMSACPEVEFLWDVRLGKKDFSSELTLLDLDTIKKNDKPTMALIRRALPCLPHVTEVNMYDYRFSTKQMDELVADFPAIHFNWTVVVDKYLVRTDSTAFSTLKGRQAPRYTADSIMKLLKYLPDLKAIDLGHNNVTDLSFLDNWPGLKILIVIDSKEGLTDISPLKDQKDLEYVELFMQKITDLSPLADHTKLLDLNLCYNDITDLSPLYSCVNLERLWISNNPHLSKEEIRKLQEKLPDLKINDHTEQSTGYGWREHPRYFTMYDIFKTRIYRPFEEE